MAINKKLIHFKSKQKFEEELANGNILETSIVFILETTEIYTHGKLYDGSTFDPSDIEASIENIINTKSDKSDLDAILDGTSVVSKALNDANGNNIIDTYATKEELRAKQDKLVNGVNIKTINGLSLLGSGVLTISGNAAYSQINYGTSNTTCMLQPNLFYVWDEVENLTLTLGSETSGVANEYLFQFTSGSEPTTLILPDSIKFNSDFTVEANKIYQISILNGLGTVMSWDIEPTIQLITFTIDGTEYQAEEGMTWEEWVNSEYNTDGFYISEGRTYKGDMFIYYMGEPFTVIVNNVRYTLYLNGGGAGN